MPTQDYRVAYSRVNIRKTPRITPNNIDRQVTLGTELTLDLSVTYADGWLWRRIAGAHLYIAEVHTATGQRLLSPISTPTTPPPTITAKPTGRVQTDGRSFTLDGHPFRFIGANLRELMTYGIKGFIPDDEHFDMQIAALQSIGMKVVRFYASHRTYSTDWCIAFVRMALDKLHDNGLLAIVCLTDALGDSKFNVRGNDKFHTEVMGHVNKDAWFHHRGYEENYLPFVRRMVSELQDHPAIFAWEIGNEFAIHPQPATEADGEAFINFFGHISQTIRAIDENHLITTGIINSNQGRPTHAHTALFARRLYAIPTLDFATVHFYQPPPDADPNLITEQEFGRIDAEAMLWLNKPLIVEEFGSTVGNPDRIQYTAATLDYWMTHRNAAGFMQWGFSATGRDIGVSDNRYGMDNYSKENAHLFEPLSQLYRSWATRLA